MTEFGKPLGPWSGADLYGRRGKQCTLGSTTPTGTVTFSDGSTVLGSVSLDSSGASATASRHLPCVSGNHTINVSYSGDAEYTSSNGNMTQTVGLGATNAVVASSSSSSVYGHSVIFTANISADLPGVGTPTGTVTFIDGSSILGTGTLNSSGVATFTSSALGVGSHTITVSFGGDTDFATSSGDKSLKPSVRQTRSRRWSVR